MIEGFLDQFIDWKEFEKFVAELYKDSEEVIVEHNVTMVGKSTAPRQIDVKVTHRTKLHTYITIIECKSWKSNVTREKLDAFATTINDVNASKGVIFTTKGYQEGAKTFAEYQNIDIFLVRDLTEEEWGLPGQKIRFYLQFINGTFQNFSFPAAQIKPIVPTLPQKLNLAIHFDKDYIDPAYYLFSIKDGKQGKHLQDILFDIRKQIIENISGQISIIIKDGNDNNVKGALRTTVSIDFSESEFCQLNHKVGFIKLSEIKFDLITTIDQTIFETDRGSNFDIALIVENYITKQKKVVSKQKSISQIDINEARNALSDEKENDGILKNNSVAKIYFDPFVKTNLDEYPDIVATAEVKLKKK